MKNNQNTYPGENIKKRLPRAALAGFTASFMFFFFGVLDIFAQNREELLFAFSDFGVPLVLFALGIAVVITELIALLPGRISDILFGVVVWISVMGYIQAVLLNGSGGLSGDSGQGAKVGFAVFDAFLWIITGAAFIIGALKMKTKGVIKTVFVILLIVVCVMQLTGCISEMKDITKDPLSPSDIVEEPASSTEEPSNPADLPDVAAAYLTWDGINEVSAGKNVIIFVIDRFDVSYYQSLMDKTPDFFDKLDGFTYFNDNISRYSRTYPGVVSMITGVDIDFTAKKATNFSNAYTTSPFLGDLKANNYKIKLYTAKFYAYTDGTQLYGVADNLSVATDYTVTNQGALVGNLLALSAYRYLPTCLKSSVDISTSSFSGLVDYNGEAPFFEMNDPAVYSTLHEKGLSLDNSENSYVLIHLNGCHDPYTMDEDGNEVEKSTVDKQLRGCFKLIYEYIDELKRLGVYDDSTIIITGDHPRARDDKVIPEQPRVTSLFVKPTNSHGALSYSSAQVSQDNLIATIVKSAGISTSNDYGRSYFDISEDETVTRYHGFQLYVKGESDRIVTFEINGDGNDFESWEIKSNVEAEFN